MHVSHKQQPAAFLAYIAVISAPLKILLHSAKRMRHNTVGGNGHFMLSSSA
ncbi:hypothetical protein [Pantoea dispersa]|uniref:hypothetical protein n=1 Tax=Pantoea dispersa TaxID=59814 RepID=UPI0039BDF7E8